MCIGICINNKEYNKILTFVWVSHQRNRNHLESNLPNDRQRSSFINWQAIVKKRREYVLGSAQHVLLSIYTAIPPRRQKEYYSMRIYTDKDVTPDLDHNQLYLSSDKQKCYIFICEHKTSRFNKTFTNKKLPDILIDTVKKSLVTNPREYLFVKQRSRSPFVDEKSFQKYSNGMLKTIFKDDGISINTLRHSFATFVNDSPDVTLKIRKDIANLMGCSFHQFLEYAFVNMGK
jgi:hypothetical protein